MKIGDKVKRVENLSSVWRNRTYGRTEFIVSNIITHVDSFTYIGLVGVDGNWDAMFFKVIDPKFDEYKKRLLNET